METEYFYWSDDEIGNNEVTLPHALPTGSGKMQKPTTAHILTKGDPLVRIICGVGQFPTSHYVVIVTIRYYSYTGIMTE